MKAVYKTASPYLADAMNLPVENLESAIPFYGKVMGFHVVSRKDSPCKSAALARDGIQISWLRTEATRRRKGVSSRWTTLKPHSRN